MKDGKNDFRVKLTQQAIAEIVDYIDTKDFLEEVTGLKTPYMPYKDLQALYIIISLQKYLKERRCKPDFEVVLDE